jgi:DNA polymerase
MPDILHIDLETRSTLDLRKTGAYPYAKHETTDIWCACYAFDDGPVKTWMPVHHDISRDGEDIFEHIEAGGIIYAHNAAFERTLWTHLLGPRYGWPIPKTEQWRCTMIQCYAMALPGALGDAAAAVGLDLSKDEAGHRLMMQMCRPRKVLPSGPVWWDVPEKIERLIAYCLNDVEVERQLHKRLRELKASELELWHLDQTINDRGVYVDVHLCDAAKTVVAATTGRLDAEIREVTEGFVSRCSNRNQLVQWVRAQGVDAESIAKGQIEELLADPELPPHVHRALTIRRESAKASVAKIDALLRGMCPDGRVRGLLQFHAASTGRWAGRRFQPQNLKRPDMEKAEEVDEAIALLLAEPDAELIEIVYGAPLSVVGDTIRGMIAAPKGKKIVSVDYAGIEARVLPWLAGEKWKLEAFRDFDRGIGHDMYCITAGRILGKHPTEIGKPDRLVYGKVPELALGYQGGVGAFLTMGVNYGVKLEKAVVEKIRDDWRAANPKIKSLWHDLEHCAIRAVQDPGSTWRIADKLAFRKAGSFLFMRLPSGRFLAYAYPEIREKEMPWIDERTGKPVVKEALSYMGVNSYTRRWERCWAYGGLLAENATQAAARDFLADAMPRVEAAGYPIIMTVHDEIVSEVDEGFGSWEEMAEIMTTLPAWGADCPIAADGWQGARYRK